MRLRGLLVVVMLIAGILGLGLVAADAAQKATNPCAPANPCAPQKAANPCAAKPASAAKTEVDPKLITRPAGTKLFAGKRAELVKMGEQLWKDTKLSTNGLSCQTCHQNNAAFKPGFAQAYPHPVDMVREKAGLAKIHLDEMVQICMVVPMAAKPLPWDSKELAALTAYAGEAQKKYKAAVSKPAAGAKNPCAAKNPGGAAGNPCAPKNPCAAK